MVRMLNDEDPRENDSKKLEVKEQPRNTLSFPVQQHFRQKMSYVLDGV